MSKSWAQIVKSNPKNEENNSKETPKEEAVVTKKRNSPIEPKVESVVLKQSKLTGGFLSKVADKHKDSNSSTANNNKANDFQDLIQNELKVYKDRFIDKKEKLCYNEVKGNLFDAKESCSLAHCVSEDLKMGKGIALEFKKRFQGIDSLTSQKPEIGNVVYLKRDKRYVYYLITKKFYYQKPLYSDLERSLKRLLELCKEHSVEDLSMPYIGAGLDKLEWPLVSRIVDSIFENQNINLTIYKFEPKNSTEIVTTKSEKRKFSQY